MNNKEILAQTAHLAQKEGFEENRRKNKMTDNSFKKADLVELHDAGVSVHPKGYPDASVGWYEYSTELEGRRFVIEGEQIANLARHLGVEVYKYTELNAQGKAHTLALENIEFHLNTFSTDVGGGGSVHNFVENTTIRELWARVDGPQLLALRITFEAVVDDEIDTMTREVTYSGNYTVWWE